MEYVTGISIKRLGEMELKVNGKKIPLQSYRIEAYYENDSGDRKTLLVDNVFTEETDSEKAYLKWLKDNKEKVEAL